MLPIVLLILLTSVPVSGLDFSDVHICGPVPEDATWVYRRWVNEYNGIEWVSAQDTIVVGAVGIEELEGRRYQELSDGRRMRADGRKVFMWRDRVGDEVVHCDLWQRPPATDMEEEYAGVFDGDPVRLYREGPGEFAVGDSIYSAVFRFQAQAEEGGGELIVDPDIGILHASWGNPISQRQWTQLLIGTADFTVTSYRTWASLKKSSPARRSED